MVGQLPSPRGRDCNSTVEMGPTFGSDISARQERTERISKSSDGDAGRELKRIEEMTTKGHD